MSQPDNAVYAATCNPPRRAKRPRAKLNDPDSVSSHHPASPPGGTLQPRPILPKRLPQIVKPTTQNIPSIPSPQSLAPEPSVESPPTSASPPNKRGRKPGPLSRSAREAQRRLNHSIIEKARRTKINNALATLRELVPVDYGRRTKLQGGNSDDEEDWDEEDADAEYNGEKKKQKQKPTGKKEEKEREYKLEILVRTVAFMQDLLHRVSVLEHANPVCSNCGDNLVPACIQPMASILTPTTLDQANSFSESSDPEQIHRSKRSRTENYHPKPAEPSQTISPIQSPSQEALQEGLLTRHRLPSISSWLPQTLLDPSIFNVTSPSRVGNARTNNKDYVPPLQLPTPPSSAQFQPTWTSEAPSSAQNFISPSGNAHKVASPIPARTPEDEHAATMLLQISGGGTGSSPTFRPLPPAIVSAANCVPAIPTLPSSAMRKQNMRGWERGDGIVVQTPASLLGLTN